MNMIVLAAVGVLALAAFIYGFIRKFTRCSWFSWQLLLAFAATLLLNVIELPAGEWTSAAISGGGLLAVSAIVLAVGGGVRYGLLAHAGQPSGAVRFFGRLFGGITALLNLVCFVAFFAAPALVAMPCFGYEPEFLSVVYASEVWSLLAPHLFDLFVVGVCLLMIRAGYRIGLARTIWTLLMLALGAGALVLAVYMTNKVPFLAALAQKIAGSFASLPEIAAQTAGAAVVSAICFVVLFVVLVLIGALCNLLVKKLRRPLVLGVADGVLAAVIFAAIFFGLAYGVNYGVYFLASGGLEELLETLAGDLGEQFGEAGEQLGAIADAVAGVGARLERLFTSSPLSAMLYRYNPIALLVG